MDKTLQPPVHLATVIIAGLLIANATNLFSANANAREPDKKKTLTPVAESSSTRSDTDSLPETKVAEVRIQKTVTVGMTGLTFERSDLGIGEFRPGTLLSVDIRVVNGGNHEIIFNRIESGCSCLSVTPASGRIPIGSAQDFTVKVKTPTSPSRVDQAASFTGHSGDSPVFSIRLHYQLSGIVGFDARSAHILVPQGSGSLTTSFRIFVDDSTPAEFVDLSVGPGLEGLEASLDFAKKMVKVVIPEDSVKHRERFGELSVRNIETDFKSTLSLSLAIESAISIFPQKLRFRNPANEASTKELDSESLIARIMVVDKNREPTSKLATLLDLSYAGQPLESSIVSTQGQITHYVIRAPRELLAKDVGDAPKATCRAIGKTSERTIELAVSVDTTIPVRKNEGASND